MTDSDDASDQSASGTEQLGHLPQVGNVPRSMLYSAIYSDDTQCVYFYAGIDQRCPNEADAFAYHDGGANGHVKVGICEDHVRDEDAAVLEGDRDA